MKKFFTFFATVATVFGMNAQATMFAVADGEEPEGVATQVVTTTYDKAFDITTVQPTALTPSRKAPAKKVAAAFPSTWTGCVVSYASAAATTWGNSGGNILVKQDDGSVYLGHLIISGSVTQAMATDTEGEYIIPNFQVVGSTTDYGDVVVTAYTVEQRTDDSGTTKNYLVVDSTAVGVKVKAVGPTTLQFEGLWGFSVKEGDNAGAAFYIANGGTVDKSNATMSWKMLGNTTTYSCYIKADQEGDSITITNFGGGGLSFKTALTSRNNTRIGGFTASYQKLTAGVKAFNINGIEYYRMIDASTAKVFVYNSGLLANAEGTKAITWGPWSTNYGSYTSGFLTEGRIDFENEITWPTSKVAEGLKGDGSETNPYLIENNDDWKAVAAASNSGVDFNGQFVKLAADLDFSNDSVPAIGSSASPFFGTFDGGNHTVTANLTTSNSCQGLIGVLDGTVKNLNAAGVFNFENVSCGSIVGAAHANSVIENCSSSAHLTLGASSTAVGGIAGHVNFRTVFRNCHFSGIMDINTTKTSAWIAGVAGYGYCADFYNCTNTGTMNVNNTTVDCVSGINAYTMYSYYENCLNYADIKAAKWVAGISGYSHTIGTSSAKNCYNFGNITTTVASGNYATAGVFGYMMYGGTYEDCQNYGNVTCTGAGGYIGGVFANYRGSADYSYIKVKKCYNGGTITGNGGNFIGGVAGFAFGVAMDSCYNFGNIVSNGTAYNKGSSVGGVIGQYQSFASDTTYFKTPVTNCGNMGKVTSKSTWTGGVVGNFATHNDLVNCWNAGKVTALNRSGGIVGYSAYEAGMKGCFNVGDVTLTATTKGIGTAANSGVSGLLGYGSNDIVDCYNAGTITGNGRAAGILGWPYHNTTATYKDHIWYTPSIRNCYNVGKIVADADSCGNILGVHTVNNGTLWRPEAANYQYKDTIENVMYLKGMAPGAITGEAANPEVGYTARELCQQLPSDNFVSVGDYCYPILKAFKDSPFAKAFAVAAVPAEDEADPSVITKDFFIGNPGDVEITSSYAGLSFDGTNAVFDGTPYEGEIVITVTPVLAVTSAPARVKATEDDMMELPANEIVINVKYDGQATGVKDLDADKAVKSVRYYNLNGAQMLEPAGACIKVLEFVDGTHKAVKVIK